MIKHRNKYNTKKDEADRQMKARELMKHKREVEEKRL